jgi:hypothetical protein
MAAKALNPPLFKNPCSPERRRKPVTEITDRAKRYRANACPPEGPRRCVYCGNPKAMDIEHISGDESDDSQENKTYACRSCNVKKGRALLKVGMGTKTRQYNPVKAEGAKSLGQWLKAVLSAKGETDDMTTRQAVAMIRATPQSRRSEFARQIWERRQARGTTGRKEDAPF